MTSCDEYVDYEASENYQIVADDYFKQSSDYEAAVVGVYDVLQWTLYNFMIGVQIMEKKVHIYFQHFFDH